MSKRTKNPERHAITPEEASGFRQLHELIEPTFFTNAENIVEFREGDLRIQCLEFNLDNRIIQLMRSVPVDTNGDVLETEAILYMEKRNNPAEGHAIGILKDGTVRATLENGYKSADMTVHQLDARLQQSQLFVGRSDSDYFVRMCADVKGEKPTSIFVR